MSTYVIAWVIVAAGFLAMVVVFVTYVFRACGALQDRVDKLERHEYAITHRIAEIRTSTNEAHTALSEAKVKTDSLGETFGYTWIGNRPTWKILPKK